MTWEFQAKRTKNLQLKKIMEKKMKGLRMSEACAHGPCGEVPADYLGGRLFN